MRYFVDTEYNWDPKNGRITPISLALVAEDGREIYLVVDFQPQQKAIMDVFVQKTVLPVLNERSADYVTARSWHWPIRDPEFARLIREFVGNDTPEFWGDYSAFDYVVLSMLMGDFEDWPESWPMHVNDLQQDAIPSLPSETPHNALADARAVRDSWFHAFQVKAS